jgi:hypothetical protein
MKDFIVVDCETQKYDHQVEGGYTNIYGMGLSCAVTYHSGADLYRFWDDREALCNYLSGNIVVTFNGITFDSVLLLGNDRILETNGITKNDKYWWINADIYVEMWRRILSLPKGNYPDIVEKIKSQKIPKGVFNLDALARNTLDKMKFGRGIDAPELFQQGRLLELYQYNLQDVRVTKELYIFIKTRKYLITGGYDVVKFD